MRYVLYISIQNDYTSIPCQKIVKKGECVDELQARGIASTFFGKSFMNTKEGLKVSAKYSSYVVKLSDTISCVLRLYKN